MCSPPLFFHHITKRISFISRSWCIYCLIYSIWFSIFSPLKITLWEFQQTSFGKGQVYDDSGPTWLAEIQKHFLATRGKLNNIKIQNMDGWKCYQIFPIHKKCPSHWVVYGSAERHVHLPSPFVRPIMHCAVEGPLSGTKVEMIMEQEETISIWNG